MRRLLFFLLLSGFQLLCLGQAKPSYTQYILNNYILNPALTGIENYTDVRLSNRNQWTGIPGAPVTSYFSFHTPIKKTDERTTATSFQKQGVNPRGAQYWADYTVPDPHHGVGLSAINDKAGYLNRWSIYASYAYHKPLSVKTSLAAGLNAGVSSVNLDRSKIYWATLNPNDPAIGYANNELKKTRPELGAGLWLYSSDYFVGVSVLNIIPGKQKFVLNDKYGQFHTPNYFLTAGYRFLLGEDFNLLPSFMVQYWQPQLGGVHINTKLQYRDVAWLGGGYRFSNLVGGYSAMAGLNISNTLNVGYSYEAATTSRLRNYTGNTHEFIIGLILGNRFGDSCPRNVW